MLVTFIIILMEANSYCRLICFLIQISFEFSKSSQSQFLFTVTFLKKLGLKSPVSVGVFYFTLLNIIYLSAWSALPKGINVAENTCEGLITLRRALLSINEFDVASVAGNDWLVGDVIGLIWHCSKLNSREVDWRSSGGCRVDQILHVSLTEEHNLPLEYCSNLRT